MRLEYVLKSANFFTSFDNDFINDDATENESDFVKQVSLVCVYSGTPL